MAPQEQPAPIQQARQKAYVYVSLRARTRRELSDYLVKKGYVPSVVSAVLEDFVRLKLIDDRAYAATWLELRLKNKPVGKRAALYALQKRGIDTGTIEEVLQETFRELDETKIARQILAKRKLTMDPKDEKQKRRIIALLARRGISMHTIYSIVNEGDHEVAGD
jgi:regulatory protein